MDDERHERFVALFLSRASVGALASCTHPHGLSTQSRSREGKGEQVTLSGVSYAQKKGNNDGGRFFRCHCLSACSFCFCSDSPLSTRASPDIVSEVSHR